MKNFKNKESENYENIKIKRMAENLEKQLEIDSRQSLDIERFSKYPSSNGGNKVGKNRKFDYTLYCSKYELLGL
ncbi:MAG: hypothetical protein LC127_07485 [Chitinophagales bacterium]|nr:hypothetical protein [Chitinophagales bacterium]